MDLGLILSIAAGIILAVLILAFLPELVVLLVGGILLIVLVALFTSLRFDSIHEPGRSDEPIKKAENYSQLKADDYSELSISLASVNADRAPLPLTPQLQAWLTEMSRRLTERIPEPEFRMTFLKTLYYEAARAGLDPELVLSLIDVKSGFDQDLVSKSGAIGFMQVRREWIDRIGNPKHNLYDVRTNLRYGCVILRHYLDIENGDLYQALSRYDGVPGRVEFAKLVNDTWDRNWRYSRPSLNQGKVALPKPPAQTPTKGN